MKIQTIPITHRIKHLQPIFTIAKGNCPSGDIFASGGVNGELKLWDSCYNPIKTIKKHLGSVTSVKFSLDGKYLASSGDDGKVFIFNTNDYELVKTIKHNSDVTHVEWTPDFLISSDFDGNVLITKIFDFSEYKRLQHHTESILGIALSSDFKLLCTYSECKIVLYEDLNIRAERSIEKGVILENLNSKISFSPNNKFISLGLQFNKKRPTVDIFDLKLDSVFSLVGHAAPSEITCFCPFSFKKIQKYYILAVASQDLSLSFWNTMNPKPFLLLKNFTESPILDMFWDGLSLFVSSYDGIVKKVEFDEKEFGMKIESNENDQEFELPFNEKNIEMQKNYEKRIEKLDFDETIELVKLTGFTIDGMSLEDFLKSGNTESNDKNIGILPIKENINESNSKKPIERISDHNNSSIKEDFIQMTNESLKSVNENQDSLNKQSNMKDIATLSSKPISPVSGTCKVEIHPTEISDKTSKPKRITPIMIDKPKSAPIHSKKETATVVLYDINQLEKIKITKSKSFKTVVNDYTIKLDDEGGVQVLRATRHFYSINGPCNKVCFNEKYLVVYTTHVQIYELETGCLVLPFIFMRLSYLDLLDSKVLVLDVYGDFTVFDLEKNKAIRDKLAKTKDLTKIELSRTHFLVAEYSNSEIVFYNKKLKIWLSINPGFNSITTNGVDFLNDNDDTMAELELSFVHYSLVDDYKNMMAVLKQFICLIRRMKKLEEFVEYKLEKMLIKVSNTKTLEMLLEEMNREIFLQKFVFKMARKFGLKI